MICINLRLTSQSYISGIGNWIADEVLYQVSSPYFVSLLYNMNKIIGMYISWLHCVFVDMDTLIFSLSIIETTLGAPDED